MAKRFLIFLFVLLAPLPALALSSTPYLNPGQVDLTLVLPPPPTPGSAEDKNDMATLHALESARGPAEAARAKTDANVTVYRFADVLGPNFTATNLPLADAFFKKVLSDESPPVNAAKNYWKRPRPFEYDPKLKPVPEMAAGVANPKDPKHPDAPVTYNFAYPSGHSTFGALMAIVLAQMVPEKREALFARGWDYGLQREIGGVHYPTDVVAGRTDAAVIFTAMRENEGFRQDFAAAKAELRRVLGLTP